MKVAQPAPTRLSASESIRLSAQLIQREEAIVRLQRELSAVQHRLQMAQRCLVLLGDRGPTGDGPLDKALWIAWLRWAASMPEITELDLPTPDQLGFARMTYDRIMDQIAIAL